MFSKPIVYLLGLISKPNSRLQNAEAATESPKVYKNVKCYRKTMSKYECGHRVVFTAFGAPAS